MAGPTITEITAKADELQSTLDTEQGEVRTKVSDLEAEIAELKAVIAAGGTEEERQVVFDKMQATIEDIKTTVTPAEPPVG